MSDLDDLRNDARDDREHEEREALNEEEETQKYYFGDDDPDTEFPSWDDELQYPHFGPDE